MIKTLRGDVASRLGLVAHPDQDARCVRRAFQGGINFFFFYGPGYPRFIGQVALLLRKHRESMIVATGSGARSHKSLTAVRRKMIAALGNDLIDVFFAEYVEAAGDADAIFG